MLRSTFLWLSENPGIFSFVKRNRLARRIASRFVAGETLDTAIEAARATNAKGIMVSLDLLGESVSSPEETHSARDEIIRTVEAVADSGINGNVSIKLTQLGLDISDELCAENARAVLDRAKELDVFVRLDMEASDYTERTLRLFYDQFHPGYNGLTGVVIQSYLRRSEQDVARLASLGARVRLCKGAYAEPEEIAFQEREEVSASFVRLMERLVEKGNYPGIATHDAELIDKTLAFVEEKGIPPERFEFQMLYGVRRDLQHELHAKGYNMRVYIPFGTAWYPYLMRRLAERPANVAFMVASLFERDVPSPVTDDSTLGGYLEAHSRPPAFEGSDGAAYSAAVYVDDTPDEGGRYGGAVMFVRWSEAGDRPVGHLESAFLVFSDTPEAADTAVRALSLHEVKAELDKAIAGSEELPS